MPSRVAAIALTCGIAAALVSGCSNDTHASAFCADAERGQSAFDSNAADRFPAAIAQFEKIAAAAPAAIAPDLKTVSAGLSILYRNPRRFVDDPARFKRYSAAISRVDEYLRQNCGTPIPRRGG